MNLIKQKKILALFKTGKYRCRQTGELLGYSNNHGGLRLFGRVIQPSKFQNGYLAYTIIGLKRERLTVLAHQLMWLYFKGGYSPLLQINHLNGSKTDNYIGNLELCTMSENIQHSIRIGFRKPSKGSKNGMSRLTEKQVLRIRELVTAGQTERSVAKEFGVSFSNINNIVLRKSWRHI